MTGKDVGCMIKAPFGTSYAIAKLAPNGDEVVERISNFVVKGNKLHLDKLHLQGSSGGKIGVSNLFEMARDLGR